MENKTQSSAKMVRVLILADIFSFAAVLVEQKLHYYYWLDTLLTLISIGLALVVILKATNFHTPTKKEWLIILFLVIFYGSLIYFTL